MQENMIGVSRTVAGTAAALMFPEASRLNGAVAITAAAVAEINEASLRETPLSSILVSTGENSRIPARAA